MKTPLLAAMLCLLVTGCATPRGRAKYRQVAQEQYVSLGSSFAAGAGIGPLQAETPVRCSRTTNNYAMLLAARLDLALTDASCSGATTSHILGRWDELPPQIDAVTSRAKLVTITIGGNDLGYVSWLFSGSCRAGVEIFPAPCKAVVEPTEENYRRLDQNLRAIAEDIRARAPQARLVFVQYVRLVANKPCHFELLSPADAAVARKIGERLAEITNAAARASGAEVLATDLTSRNHTACSNEPWSAGLMRGYDKSKGAPWHPNAAGHRAIADQLFKLVSGKLRDVP